VFAALQDVLVNAAGQRYVVLDMLGSGTFGQVVSAYSEAAGRPVAVKVRERCLLKHMLCMWLTLQSDSRR
jgi:hypothetical protein